MSLKDHNPNSVPTYPAYRSRIEGELTLHKNNKTFNVCAELTRWALEDLACDSIPFYGIVGPGPEAIKFTGHKVEFLK